ncbi:TPA: transposase, partial [Staphylococcus aureus]|nr:transposase [Staphylococcus aureus]HDB7719055.1 transposase [Staphylococcus aureus]
KNNSDGKDALISSLKRRVKSLENEKKRLKDEINTLYNKIYEDI